MFGDTEISKAVRRSIKNILFEGTTDVPVFNYLFEIEILQNSPQLQNDIVYSIVESISNCDFNSVKLKLYNKILVPKSKIAEFRFVAFMDLYEEIFYLTLAILLAPFIERERINLNKYKIFSYRYSLDNKNSANLFNKNYSYTAFKSTTSKNIRKKGNNITVYFDISNFYDRLNLHRLNSQLLSIETLKGYTDVIEFLNQLLLYWSSRDSYGLPVGSNASRILAEASLIGVDSFLEEKNIKFVRYVDDYRIFTTDLAEAYEYMNLISSRLQKEGLFINGSKIKFIDNAQFISYSSVLSSNADATSVDVENHDFDKNDSDKLQFWKIVNQYSGSIPLKFRELSDTQIYNFKQEDLNDTLNNLEKRKVPETSATQKMFRILVAKQDWQYIRKVAKYVFKKEPHFIPLFTDILIKKKSQIMVSGQQDIKKIIADAYENLKYENTPEYIKVYLVRFIGKYNELFDDNLVNYFLSSKGIYNNYLLRATLDVIYESCLPLTRNDAILLRDSFQRANMFEKRAIIRILNKSLPKEEKNAFFKNVRMSESDDILLEISKADRTS